MSTQKDITDAMITALGGVTGVNLVTKDINAWNQSDPQSYSTLFISPKKAEGDQVFFRHPTSDDMYATLEITIEGDIRDQYKTTVEASIDTLMKNVEIAINSNAALNALVVDIFLESDEFIGVDEYGLFTAVYIADYYYNHLSP